MKIMKAFNKKVGETNIANQELAQESKNIFQKYYTSCAKRLTENKKLKDKKDIKHNINYMHKIANERRGRCISSKYVNNKSHLLWECENKHQWLARPDGIIRGTWCKICKGKSKYNLEFCKNIAKQKSGDCISNEYINNKTLLNWKCSQGHIWKNTLSGILNAKQWCPYCYGNVKHTISEMKEVAKTFGGDCLSDNYSAKHAKNME